MNPAFEAAIARGPIGCQVPDVERKSSPQLLADPWVAQKAPAIATRSTVFELLEVAGKLGVGEREVSPVQAEAILARASHRGRKNLRIEPANRILYRHRPGLGCKGTRGQTHCIRRRMPMGIDRNLRRIGADSEHSHPLELALALEIVGAGEGEEKRPQQVPWATHAMHQKVPFTPKMGKMGRPVKYCRCR